MAVEEYYSFAVEEYLTFYPGETSDGCFAANYKDQYTKEFLREPFLGALQSLALPRTLKGNAVQGECKVSVSGVETKLGYYMSNGHYCISTFKGDGDWFGYGKSNQANSLGLQLFVRGEKQTKENVCSFLKLVPKADMLKKKYTSYEEYAKEKGLDIFSGTPDGDKEKGPKNLVGKFVEYPKLSGKEFEEALNKVEMIKVGNLSRIGEAIADGGILFPYERDGQRYINRHFYEALYERGIEMEKIPDKIAENIGFTQTGVLFKTVGGKDFLVKGVMFRLDDLTGQGSPYQFRCMEEVFSKKDAKKTFKYVTKAKGTDLRYYNTGAATTFGLFHALSDEKRRPVVVTEGVFDALSVYAGGENRLNAVALQGCGNQQYFLEHAKEFKEKGIPIILALDEDRAGINGRNRLIEGLQKEKVDFTVFPGTLGYGDLNDLLRSDMKNGKESTERGHKAEKLLLLTAEVVFLARERKYTPRKLERIIEGISQGRVKGDVGKNGTQIGAATLILNKVKEEGLFLLEQFKDKTEDEKDKIREAFLTTCLEAIHTAGGVQQERTPEISQNINGTERRSDINAVYKELKAQPEESEKIQNKGANPKESWQRDTDR